MSLFHEHVLSVDQQRLLKRLGPVADELGFYMAGGTAVALRLGHRESEDFDWFSADAGAAADLLVPDLAERGLAVAPLQISTGTLHCSLDGVRVTFLRYRYAMLAEPEYWSTYGCRIASLDDLTCMKLSAVAQRGSKKDFIDIYAILRQGASLGTALQNYRRKFGVQDATPVLYGLAYFDDAEQEPMPKMLLQEDWGRMKSAIQRWTQEAVG